MNTMTVETIKEYETEPSIHVTECVSDYDAVTMLLEEVESMALAGYAVKVWNHGRNGQAVGHNSITVFYVA